MTDLRARLADALSLRRHEFRYPLELHPSCCTCGNATEAFGQHLADVVLSLDGIAIVELPEPDSDRYEGDEHEPEDRLGWINGNYYPHDVSVWDSGEVQLGYQGVNAEPLTVNAARSLAAALLAAANAAEGADR